MFSSTAGLLSELMTCLAVTRGYVANLEEEAIVDAPGNDGSASMPEQVKRPNPWRKIIIIIIIIIIN